MNKRSNLISAALVLSFSAPMLAQLSDTTPPQLRSFDFSPRTVDTSTNFQIITITARATDDLSGLASSFDSLGRPRPLDLGVSFSGPDAGSRITASLSATGSVTNSRDITWTGELMIPQFTHAGTWTLAQIGMEDLAGNQPRITAVDVVALGGPITFQVTGIEDRTPPEIRSLIIETNTIDTSLTHRSVKFTADIQDDLSGFGSFDREGRAIPGFVFLNFVGPSQARVQGRAIIGSGGNGLSDGTIEFPRYTAAGFWRLDSIYCADRSGNAALITAGSELARAAVIEVSSAESDTSAPQLRSLSFFPRRIDAFTNYPTINFTCRIVDDLSGLFARTGFGSFFGGGSALFESPSKNQQVSVIIQSGGDPLDSVASGFAYFRPYAETGVWTLRGIAIRDIIGNEMVYESSDLRRLGFPTELAVGIQPQLSIARQRDSLLLSWPAWASDFLLQSRDSMTAGNWQSDETSPVILEERAVVALPVTTSPQFYRLKAEP